MRSRIPSSISAVSRSNDFLICSENPPWLIFTPRLFAISTKLRPEHWNERSPDSILFSGENVAGITKSFERKRSAKIDTKIKRQNSHAANTDAKNLRWPTALFDQDTIWPLIRGFNL